MENCGRFVNYYSALSSLGDTFLHVNIIVNCISSSLGVNFDFFGIGEFWGCKSLRNDFGLQYRLFYYERASLIGGVALKAGRSLLTVMTIKTNRPRDSPIVRYVTNVIKWYTREIRE